MTIKHTPGPWRVEGCDATSVEVHALAPFGKQCVAVMDGGPRMEADARLIAAAPDMLAALRELNSCLRFEGPAGVTSLAAGDARLDKLCAAIAKATGGAP